MEDFRKLCKDFTSMPHQDACGDAEYPGINLLPEPVPDWHHVYSPLCAFAHLPPLPQIHSPLPSPICSM